ncbi:MAG: hypothetical protein Q3976_05925 [Corynebacterium sp.]|nr:hypothetical protein [Corynebacterium sp.]
MSTTSTTSSVFSDFTFNNGVHIANRLAVAPMTHWASNPDGSLSAAERTFIDGRGTGFALFISAATLVTAHGKAFNGEPHALSEADLPALRERAEIAHAGGNLAILQLHHGGRLALPHLVPDGRIFAPSADAETGAQELTLSQITAIIEGFGRATELALAAGYDGVEIHGANNYLLQQFISGATNHRNDAYGQDRLLLTKEVLAKVLAVRTAANRGDFIVGYRLSPEEPFERGITMNDTRTLIETLNDFDLQYVHISLGDFFAKSHRGADTGRPRLETIRKILRPDIALVGVGNLLNADDIARAFATDWVDIIALGKAVMLNPNLYDLLQNDPDAIVTAADPANVDHYGIPPRLWQMVLLDQPWLPSLQR